MSRLVFEEKYQVHWLPDGVSAPLWPTTAEIDAGTEITDFIPKDGIKFGVSNDRVDAGSIATAFKAESMGTYGAQVAITAFHDDETDTAWDLFKLRLTEGALVVLPYIGKDVEVEAGQRAIVFPDLETGIPVPMDPATNERQKFTVDFAMTNRDPQFAAEVVDPT